MDAGTVLSLHRITQLPLDLSDPVYRQYPLLKLGVGDSVTHYAQQLVPLAAQLIAATPELKDWVLTSPPYHVIPSAADLLCWQVCELLKNTLPEPFTVSVIDIRETRRDSQSQDRASIKKNYDYSKLSWEDRKKSRERTSQYIIPEPKFRDRPAIFVNDINVTGAQQRVMESYFERVGAARVDWLYAIDVEASIGKSEPQLENAINYSSHASLEEFERILTSENIQYTSKCIWRLFGYGLEEMERLFRSLDGSRKAEILDLVVREGRFNSAYFQEKVELLRDSCS